MSGFARGSHRSFESLARTGEKWKDSGFEAESSCLDLKRQCGIEV